MMFSVCAYWLTDYLLKDFSGKIIVWHDWSSFIIWLLMVWLKLWVSSCPSNSTIYYFISSNFASYYFFCCYFSLKKVSIKLIFSFSKLIFIFYIYPWYRFFILFMLIVYVLFSWSFGIFFRDNESLLKFVMSFRMFYALS